jgi:ABC-2 type transport system permease protein
MNHKYLMLIRRELWESRALWIAPLCAAALVLVATAFGQFHMGPGEVQIDGMDATLAGPQVAKFGAISVMGIASFLTGIAGIVSLVYTLDCLFAERKDRSILFWKSLPVSDTETVLSKLAVGLVVVPLIVLALVVVLQPLLAGIAYLRFDLFRSVVGADYFHGVLLGIGRLIVGGVFAILWLAPVTTYLMLASVAAKRAPLLYAALPPFALFLAEKIMLGADSNHVARFVGQRLFPWPGIRGGSLFNWDDGAPSLNLDWFAAFADYRLWLGLVAAAGMLYIIIRLRRFRDDT